MCSTVSCVFCVIDSRSASMATKTVGSSECAGDHVKNTVKCIYASVYTVAAEGVGTVSCCTV